MNLRSFLLTLLAITLAGCAEVGEPEPASVEATTATYVDESQCASCHPGEASQWTNSHHDLAMQEVSDSMQPGLVPPGALRSHGVVSSVRRSDDSLWITTDDASGNVREMPVSAVFGVDPLQQYIVDMPGGRRQVTTVALNTTTGKLFHTQLDESIDHTDELHWTRSSQNWNYMCAECHATGLKRGFDPQSMSFTTTAYRFDVGCQACHGPASEHLRIVKAEANSYESSGFPVDLASSSALQIETCARCHSRRAPLSDGYDLNSSLHDDYRVSLLDEGLYYADGQIQDEVYAYGSFLQSKMHLAGMRCTDCHNAHTATTKLEGNSLCVTCHNASAPAAGDHIDVSGLQKKSYDAPEHHFHEISANVACVDCHAPTTTYMVVDDRHDHSFRIPRPDLSVKYGVPNACTKCHTNKSNTWASNAVNKWYGTDRPWHPVEAIDAGRRGLPEGESLLASLVNDPRYPAITRATALELLSQYPGDQLNQLASNALRDQSPLIRRAAVAAHRSVDIPEVQTRLREMLRDPVRSVRFEAMSLVDLSVKDPLLEQAVSEYVAIHKQLGGRGSAALNLGSMMARMGNLKGAEAQFRQAVREDEFFVPGWVNLADVVRFRNEQEAELILVTALSKMPRAALLHYVLGLSLTRQGKKTEALRSFEKAVELDPTNGQFSQVLQMAREA